MAFFTALASMFVNRPCFGLAVFASAFFAELCGLDFSFMILAPKSRSRFDMRAKSIFPINLRTTGEYHLP